MIERLSLSEQFKNIGNWVTPLQDKAPIALLVGAFVLSTSAPLNQDVGSLLPDWRSAPDESTDEEDPPEIAHSDEVAPPSNEDENNGFIVNGVDLSALYDEDFVDYADLTYEEEYDEAPYSDEGFDFDMDVLSDIEWSEELRTYDSYHRYIVGNPYEPSADVPCYEETIDMGVHDGYHRGERQDTRLCALPNLPSTSIIDRPDTNWSIEGANGYALVNSRISEAAYKKIEQARADLGDSVEIVVNSSFRTNDRQHYLCYERPNNASTERCRNGEKQAGVAKPKWSRHQLGLALDYVGLKHEIPRPPDGTSCETRYTMPDNELWVWLSENAHKYGFGQLPYEGWHWEYRPKERNCDA